MVTRSRALSEQDCSVARSLLVVGERWTLLIVRDVFLGLHRFDELQTDLGIARSMLTERLRALVAEGVLERIRYQEHPERFEYHLTPKGRDLAPVLTALQLWGDAHASGPDGPPRRVVHTSCQHDTVPRYVCSHCGDTVAPDQVRTPRVRRRPHVQASPG